jgi:DNA invertase Pin-like site-specific DNA recombinase
MRTPFAQGEYASVQIYCRVSTASQTVERQIVGMNAEVLAYDEAVYHEDLGFSGGDRGRPGLLMMKAHLNVPSRKPKLVIIHELDRLFRDCPGFLNFVETYCLNGNTHLYIVHNRMLITNIVSEEQQMMYTMLAMMAELERKRIARRTKERMNILSKQGRKFGRARDTNLDMKITDLHFAGMSTYAIAKELGVSNGKIKRAKADLGYNETPFQDDHDYENDKFEGIVVKEVLEDPPEYHDI